MIKIVKDKDPIWDVDDFEVILLGTSTYNLLSGGFQSKLKYKLPLIEEYNDRTKYADKSKLGTRITVPCEPIVSLMYICNYPHPNEERIDYEALKRCLLTANVEFKGKKALTTIVGSSIFDGCGDKDKCLSIIEECTKDLDLTVYDYEQKKRQEEIKEQKKYLRSLQYTDVKKYELLKGMFDSYLKKLYLNG